MQHFSIDGQRYEISNEARYSAALGRWVAAVSARMDVGLTAGAYDTEAARANKTALASACTAAIASGSSLRLGAGTFAVDTTSSSTGVAYVTGGHLVVEGAGMDATTIKCGPLTLTEASILFYVAAGKTLVLRNLTLEGPTLLHASEAADGSNANTCFGVFHQGNGTLIFENVRFTRQGQCFKADALVAASSKGCHVYLRGCIVKGRQMGCLVNEGTDATTASFTAIDTIFEKDSDQFTFSSSAGHNCYINQGVSVNVIGCKFWGTVANGYGLHLYAGTGLVPRYTRIVGTEFRNTPYTILTNSLGPTFIDDCSFVSGSEGNAHIIPTNDFYVTNCRFQKTSTDSGYCIADDLGANARGVISNCSFNNGGSNGYLNFLRRTMTDETKPWIVRDCHFYNVKTGGNAIIGTGGRIDFDKCWFYTTTGNDLTNITKGYYTFSGCHFSSSTVPYLTNSAGALTVELNDNDFTGVGFQIDDTAANAIVVRGRNNLTGGTGNVYLNGGTATHVTGHMQMPPGLATHSASGGYLSIHGGDMAVINTGGTPAYDGLDIAAPAAGAALPLYGGAELTLVAQQAFTLNHGTGTSGRKFVLSTGANKTVAANTSIKLRYVPALSAWLEVSAL